MSSPLIVSSNPANGAADVVLGKTIVVGFDQLVDQSTVTAATFSVTGPGQTAIIAPGEFIQKTPSATTGREYITGTFAFTTVNSGTVVTFTPSKPFRPNVTYTILVVGTVTGSSAGIKNSAGEALAHNYEWSFTTGDLQTTVPPAFSPLPVLSMPMDPSQVRLTTRTWAVGNNLAQEITITFPGPIDPNSVDVDQIQLSLEALLGDPTVVIPANLTPQVSVSGNKITIVISGWPAS